MRLEAEAQKSSDYIMYQDDMKYKIQAAHVMAVESKVPSVSMMSVTMLRMPSG